jgi:hypothetical protein
MSGLTAPHRLMGNENSGPQLMSNVADTAQYGVHITTSGGGVVYRRSLSTGAVTDTFDLSTISSNPLSLPLDNQNDGHYGLSIGIDADDVIHIAGNDHDSQGTAQRYVSAPAAGFTTAGNWTHHPSDFASLATGGDNGGYTYYLFDRTSDGTLIWFMSQSESAASSIGRDWLGFKRVSGSWTALVSDGHFATCAGTPDRVYMNGVECYPRPGLSDRVFVYGIWRLTDTDPDTQEDPWLLYSDDLSTWRDIDGTAHTMPITYANRAGATITSAPAISAVQRLGIQIDPATGYPSIATRDGGTGDPEAYVRLYWDGAAWQSETISPLVGQISLVTIRGQRWIRHKHLQTAVTGLKNYATGATFRIGGPIIAGGIIPNHDPIRLRRHGIYSLCVGDGDIPVVYEYGNGVRRPA